MYSGEITEEQSTSQETMSSYKATTSNIIMQVNSEEQ